MSFVRLVAFACTVSCCTLTMLCRAVALVGGVFCILLGCRPLSSLIFQCPISLHRKTLCDVLPFWPAWSEDEELELQLNSDELEAYGNLDFGFSLDGRLLNMMGQCPTLLHLMGNVLRACPCQCRGPLSKALLCLKDFMVSLSNPSTHLWAIDTSILCVGCPCTLRMGNDLRGLLSQLGQVASPIQCHWMLSHFWSLFGLLDPLDLRRVHEAFVLDHIRQHVRQWTPPASLWPRDVTLDYPSGETLSLCLSGPTSCADLLSAEAALGHAVAAWCLFDDFGSLDFHDWIIGTRIEIKHRIGFGLSAMDFPPSLGFDDLLMTREGLDLVQHAGLSSSQFLSPRNLAALLELWPESAVARIQYRIPRHVLLHGFFLVDQHWIYFKCEEQHGLLWVQLCDGLHNPLSTSLGRLCQKI
eukprot:s1080_g36.t1